MNETKISLQWGENMTLESIACQLQKNVKKYVYVADGLYLRSYDNLAQVPSHKRVLEHETSTSYGTEYYIRDTETSELLCCFLVSLKNAFLAISTEKQKMSNKYSSSSSSEYVPNPNNVVINIKNPYSSVKTVSMVDYL